MNTTPGSLDFEMKRYDKPRIPAHQRALYVVAVIALFVIFYTA